MNLHRPGLFWWVALVRNFPVPPTPVLSQKYCRTSGRCTEVQMGGVLQCKWEVYCWVSLSWRLGSQGGTAIQMGGVLPYKLEVCCRTFSKTSKGWVVTGRHWTGSPNKSIDQIGNNCLKNVRKFCFQRLRTLFGHFSDIFRHFSDILLTFPSSGLSNNLPVTRGGVSETLLI